MARIYLTGTHADHDFSMAESFSEIGYTQKVLQRLIGTVFSGTEKISLRLTGKIYSL